MPDATNFLGTMFSGTLPAWQRTYFEMVLLETLRVKSILVPFTVLKEDFDAVKTGRIVYSEVFDMEPNWNPLEESSIWLKGGHLDSRTVPIDLEIHGDILKFGDYNEIVQYINRGDIRGLVKNKIGQNMIDTLDILARNAFLEHPNKTFAGGAANRLALGAADVFDPDLAEIIRTHLEENDIPGVAGVDDGDTQTIACATTPRVIHDIRVGAGSDWIDVQNYHQTGRKFTAESGMWAGVRFVKTNRLRLRNAGEVGQQTTLALATVPGQGAAATVDKVYTPGQPNSTRFITLASIAGLAVNNYITIHDQDEVDPGDPPVEGDGTQETRRIVSIDVGNVRVTLDKPLLKPHRADDFVTLGRDIHASIFMGGAGVVYGVGERPHPVLPPKFDDLMYINRIGWRGFLKFQLFRPEYYEVVESAGSTT